jgi:alkane 1-monooxygenase
MKDLKYLFAYTVPVSVYISFNSYGLLTYSAIFYVFLILPVLDILTGETDKNLSLEEVS